jgi:hypothetical protein
MLTPIEAPYFDNANLLIAADCVPFAFPDFHGGLLEGRTLLIGCPKLDEVNLYLEKLKSIFTDNNINSIEIAFMEVPCCSGLVHLVGKALSESGRNIPVSLIRIGIRGEIIETRNMLAGREKVG